MRASQQTYKNVAHHCSAYSPREKEHYTSSNRAGDTEVTCTTCRHFTEDAYCALDFFDPIVEKHDL